MIRGSVGSPMLIGYVRSRTDGMDTLAAQRQVLRESGCGQVIEELLATAQALGLAAIGTLLATPATSSCQPRCYGPTTAANVTGPAASHCSHHAACAVMIEQKRAMAAGAALKGCPD